MIVPDGNPFHVIHIIVPLSYYQLLSSVNALPSLDHSDLKEMINMRSFLYAILVLLKNIWWLASVPFPLCEKLFLPKVSENFASFQVLVPVADGTEEMEAVMIIVVLRRAKAEVVVASVGDKLEIMASRKVKLVADLLLEEAVKSSYDLVVLPGGLGGAQAFANSEHLVSSLKKQKEANRPYGAICASPALVLEPHGLLKGKKATAFPAMCDKLSDQGEAENRVVVDGNLITSRGPGTSMEFSLAIVEKLFGRKKALELAKTMVFL